MVPQDAEDARPTGAVGGLAALSGGLVFFVWMMLSFNKGCCFSRSIGATNADSGNGRLCSDCVSDFINLCDQSAVQQLSQLLA